jgi:hypothetical protein
VSHEGEDHSTCDNEGAREDADRMSHSGGNDRLLRRRLMKGTKRATAKVILLCRNT